MNINLLFILLYHLFEINFSSHDNDCLKTLFKKRSDWMQRDQAHLYTRLNER